MPKTHAKKFQILKEDFAYTYICDNATAVKLLGHLEQFRGQRMGLDIETTYKPEFKEWNGKKIKPKRGPSTGLAPHITRTRLVQIYDPKHMTWILDCFHVDISIVVSILSDHKWIAHFATFEQKHIRKLSPELECLDIECSMVAAYLIDRAEHSPFEADEEDEEELEEEEERKGKNSGFGLHALSVKYLNFPLKKEFQADGWDEPELAPEKLAYAATDAVICKRLHSIFVPKIASYGMEKIYRLSNLMVPVIAEMESTGFCVDHDVHKQLIKKWGEDAAVAKIETDKYFPGINLNSTKQLAKWVVKNLPHEIPTWPLTKKGIELEKKGIEFNREEYLTFGRPAIPHLRTYKAIDALLIYKKVAKLLSTYGESLRDFINPYSNRIHPEYTLGETRTGRLSSKEPNGQNMPSPETDKLFRAMFVAPPGCKLVAQDFSQIEIRVQAELSRDPVMLRSFDQKIDLHRLIVFKMTGKPMESIGQKSVERRLGKELNFGLGFGAGANTLRKRVAYQMGQVLTDEEAQHGKDTYYDLYSTYINWSNDRRREAEILGYTTTPLGKRRKLVKTEIYTKAVNCPVQGGAAEVLMMSLVVFFHKVRKQGLQKFIRISATVHDSIMLFALNGYEEKANELLIESCKIGMLYVFPRANVKDICEGGIGSNWSEV